MKEVKDTIKSLFETYPMRKIGFIVGVILGAVILTFGFFPTLFALFCGIIGLYIGSRFDEGDDLVSRTLKKIEHALPDRFQRW